MKKTKLFLILLIVALLGIGTSILGFHQLRSRSRFILEEKFVFRTYDFEVTLKERLIRNRNILQACGGFVHASTYVSGTEWDQFLGAFNLQQTFPAIRWVGLAKVTDQPEAFIKEHIEKEKTTFRIWPKITTPSATLIYTYPKAFNELIGYNFYDSEKLQFYANATTVKSEIFFTDGLSFIPSDKVKSIFLFFFPVIQNNQIEGKPLFWTVASIDLFIMINKVAEGLALNDLNIQVYEGDENSLGNLVFERIIQQDPDPIFRINRELQIGHRKLTFSFTNTPEYRKEENSSSAYFVLFVYLIITFIFVYTLYRYFTKARVLDYQSGDCTIPNTTVIDHIESGILGVDMSGKTVCINNFAKRQFGYEKNEVLNKLSIDALVDIENTKKIGGEFSRVLNRELKSPLDAFAAQSEKETPHDVEWLFVRKDKSTFAVVLSVSKMQNAEGAQVGYLGTFRMK